MHLMSSEDRVRRLLYGDHRQFKDTPDRSARARETITRTRAWESGRIGNIEEWVAKTMICHPNKLFTTGELARAIYCHPTFDQNFRFREKGEKPPKLTSWQYLAIRKAAPTFADCEGRSTARGRPWLWRLRRDEFFSDVRDAKRRTKQNAKSLAGRESRLTDD
jgi:hypothetical protein